MLFRSVGCTVDEVIQQLELNTDTDNNLATDIDTLIATKYANQIGRIQRLIYEVTDKLHQVTGYSFVPYLKAESRRLTLIRNRKELILWNGELQLSLAWANQPLLSISSLTWDGTAKTSGAYAVGDGSTYPAEYVALNPAETWSYGDSFGDSAIITGVWGYHNNPDLLWRDSGDTVQDNPLSDSATTLNVSDGSNFETYQYIRIEDEYLLITSISTNALTVERGVLGTTASAHVANTQIDTLQIHDVARSAVRRLVVAEFLNPGELNSSISVNGATVTITTGNDESKLTLPRKRFVVRAV